MNAYVSMVADLFHTGHINLLQHVHDLGYTVIVGVHSDADVESYKRTPIMSLEERVAAVSACRFVSKVISNAPLKITEEFMQNNAIDMVFHGHTPSEDLFYNEMFKVPIEMSKFTRTERTPGISTTMLIDRVERVESNAIKIRVSSLYDKITEIQQSRVLRVLETHNGISGIIADTACEANNEFDALWSSSLTASVSKGKPDIEVVDTSMRLQIVRDTMEVTKKPMIYDADTGGQPEILRFTVRALEDMGVSACIIEDKCGLKQNSLFGTTRKQSLEDIALFCDKIKAAVDARTNKKFMVIARIEALISGAGQDEALRRAQAYIEAGADAIMIHSSAKSFCEIASFMLEYQKFVRRVPVVAVPSTYYTVTEDDLFTSGITICIYANQMLRAAYPRMETVAKSILRAGTARYVQDMLTPVKQIITLLPNTGDIQDIPRQRPLISDKQVQKIDAVQFAKELTEHGIRSFFGVPDSVLKEFCNAIEDLSCNSKIRHVIASNEGAALANATGWHLATGDVPIVYCQNSGFGNMVNPLMSLCHQDAFGIPVVLVIGWRGEPSTNDEPQHKAQGRQMKQMLESCEIAFHELPSNLNAAICTMKNAENQARESGRPVAVLVRHNMFLESKLEVDCSIEKLSRYEAISGILNLIVDPTDFVVSTTGYTSRELYGIRKAQEEATKTSSDAFNGNFYMVGSMGHALSIAQGIALAQPFRRVWCIDGDGSALMHMGSLSSTQGLKIKNLVHVVLNNSCHESVGGQKTAVSQTSKQNEFVFNFADIARGLGYCEVRTAHTKEEIQDLHTIVNTKKQSTFIEIITGLNPEHNKRLPRPKESLSQLRYSATQFLSADKGTQ